MAIIVQTPAPAKLLADIKTAIKEGHVETWLVDPEGDFTHEPEQWRKKAWLNPTVVPGVLVFGLLGQKNVTMTKAIYGTYHGRFIEMLLTHFDDEFTSIMSTAQKESKVDHFKTAE